MQVRIFRNYLSYSTTKVNIEEHGILGGLSEIGAHVRSRSNICFFDIFKAFDLIESSLKPVFTLRAQRVLSYHLI